MAEPIRERILAALATQLNALRNPYALDYDEAQVTALYDEGETISAEWDSTTHVMTVRLTTIDKYDEEGVARGTAANRLMASLHTLALSNLTLSGLCENITVQQASPAYSEDPSAYVGALLELAVTYRTAKNDLYALP